METNPTFLAHSASSKRQQLSSSMQIQEKYGSYHHLVREVDLHNNKLMMAYTDRRHEGHEEGGKCLDQIRVDNDLLRDYTNAVYKQYKLNNSFDTKSNMSSQKTLNSVKRQIKLTKKQNTSTTNPPNLKPNYPYSISCKSVNTLTQNAITPTKAPSIKKSTLKSTAHTHMRSKTWLSHPKSTQILNQQVAQTQYKIRQTLKSQNNQIYISDFDDVILETQQKIPTNLPKLNNEQYAQNYNKYLQQNPSSLKKKLTKTCCPICQQQLTQPNIPTHEDKCPQLSKLYNLQQSSLSQYVSWKIEEHLGTIRTILTNLQIKKSVMMENNNDHEQQYREQSQHEIRIKDINRKIDLEQISYPSLAIKKKEYIDGIMSQCGEQIKKCIWFQEIKENLIQTNSYDAESLF